MFRIASIFCSCFLSVSVPRPISCLSACLAVPDSIILSLSPSLPPSLSLSVSLSVFVDLFVSHPTSLPVYPSDFSPLLSVSVCLSAPPRSPTPFFPTTGYFVKTTTAVTRTTKISDWSSAFPVFMRSLTIFKIKLDMHVLLLNYTHRKRIRNIILNVCTTQVPINFVVKLNSVLCVRHLGFRVHSTVRRLHCPARKKKKNPGSLTVNGNQKMRQD